MRALPPAQEEVMTLRDVEGWSSSEICDALLRGRHDMTTNVPTPPEDDLPCATFVEMVTDYLDGTIPPDLRARVEAHLSVCPGCTSILDQIRQVIRLAGRLGEKDVVALPDAEREQLMAAFRTARSRR
jgi:hypothetical protein